VLLICRDCGRGFKDVLVIDAIPHHLRARTRCLDCRPFRPRRSP